MAWTQDDADALKAAIASGARDVTYSDGSRIVYRSLAEMREVLAMIEAEVAGASVTRVRTVRLNSSKGF
jgi:transcriptional/translational regulatory protein YebC/TACO1